MKYEKRERKNQSKHVSCMQSLMRTITGKQFEQKGAQQFKDLNIKRKSKK